MCFEGEVVVGGVEIVRRRDMILVESRIGLCARKLRFITWYNSNVDVVLEQVIDDDSSLFQFLPVGLTRDFTPVRIFILPFSVQIKSVFVSVCASSVPNQGERWYSRTGIYSPASIQQACS